MFARFSFHPTHSAQIFLFRPTSKSRSTQVQVVDAKASQDLSARVGFLEVSFESQGS